MFLIKQVSSDLGITPQAIYKQKEELQSKGYMIKNSSNDWEITSDSYNYLKEKQKYLPSFHCAFADSRPVYALNPAILLGTAGLRGAERAS